MELVFLVPTLPLCVLSWLLCLQLIVGAHEMPACVLARHLGLNGAEDTTLTSTAWGPETLSNHLALLPLGTVSCPQLIPETWAAYAAVCASGRARLCRLLQALGPAAPPRRITPGCRPDGGMHVLAASQLPDRLGTNGNLAANQSPKAAGCNEVYS